MGRFGGGVDGGRALGGGRLLLKGAGTRQEQAALGRVRRWHKLEHRQSDDARVNARSASAQQPGDIHDTVASTSVP